MSEQLPERPSRRGGDRHPVWWGLAALVGVAVLVGAILGGGVWTAAKVLGVDSTASTTDTPKRTDSLIIPKLTAGETGGDNYPTLLPVPSDSTSQTATAPSSPSTSQSTPPAKPDRTISLSAGETQVSVMGNIDISGTYPGGEGAILQVQQRAGGAWTDFPVTTPVSNETFSTYIQSAQQGLNKFRVEDTDTGKVSNVIRVQVG